MKPIALYPYPRMSRVEWSQATLQVDGQPVDPAELADRWDADSTISVAVKATVQNSELTPFDTPTLTLNAGCRETAESRSGSAPFMVGTNRSTATATVTLKASKLAQQIEVRAAVTAPYGGAKWLNRRIIAEKPAERINLQTELQGFPTSAISFKAEHWRPAPWLLNVSATHLSDTFAHSIRLLLNLDYPRVEELIDGRAQAHVDTALHAAILRTLLQTARRLADDYGDDANIGKAITEFPDSFAAAADKASRDYLNRPLTWTVSRLRTNPEEIEYLIDSSLGSLKEKR